MIVVILLNLKYFMYLIPPFGAFRRMYREAAFPLSLDAPLLCVAMEGQTEISAVRETSRGRFF